MAAPFDVIAHEGEEPDGGLEEVFEGREPGRERGAGCVLRIACSVLRGERCVMRDA